MLQRILIARSVYSVGGALMMSCPKGLPGVCGEASANDDNSRRDEANN